MSGLNSTQSINNAEHHDLGLPDETELYPGESKDITDFAFGVLSNMGSYLRDHAFKLVTVNLLFTTVVVLTHILLAPLHPAILLLGVGVGVISVASLIYTLAKKILCNQSQEPAKLD